MNMYPWERVFCSENGRKMTSAEYQSFAIKFAATTKATSVELTGSGHAETEMSDIDDTSLANVFQQSGGGRKSKQVPIFKQSIAMAKTNKYSPFRKTCLYIMDPAGRCSDMVQRPCQILAISW